MTRQAAFLRTTKRIQPTWKSAIRFEYKQGGPAASQTPGF
jgi:hypothetical protein